MEIRIPIHFKIIVLFACLAKTCIFSAPVHTTFAPNAENLTPSSWDPESPPPADTAIEFMKRFGYLSPGVPNSEALYKEEAITDAIKTMQKFGAIPQTGILDNATLQLMTNKRCGVPDIIRIRRTKRYIIASEGWKKRNLTYFVANWTPKLGEENVFKEMQRAFDAWSGYARLSFQYRQDPNADIIIAFGRGPHGDNYPFDGPGNILAHAYFPYEHGEFGGDIHFDDEEEWKMNPHEMENGVDFFSVAVHELGHSLGLAHSPVSGSIMFPYYKGYQSHFQLDYDDILAMYEMYISRNLDEDVSNTSNQDSTDFSNDDSGKEESKPPETDDGFESDASIETTGIPTPSMPTEPQINVTYAGDDETVEDHLQHDSSTFIPQSTPNIPNLCEGKPNAISLLRNELFVFKNKYVWRLSDRNQILEGYPVPIHQLFWALPNTVRSIDAVYQREKDQSIILFSGNLFWVHDGDKLIENSPLPLTAFGLPPALQKIDAAFVWGKNGKTFIFSGEQYWRYNETTKEMDHGYPHNISRWRGIPNNIDTAFTWSDGQTYFFKDKHFWRFNNYLIKADRDYPLPAPQYWFNCP